MSKISIKKKIIISFLSVTIFLGLITTSVIYYSVKNTMFNAQKENMLRVAKSESSVLQKVFDQGFLTTESISSDPNTKEYFLNKTEENKLEVLSRMKILM
jgi:exopolysaccharide biosynthesis protein